MQGPKFEHMQTIIQCNITGPQSIEISIQRYLEDTRETKQEQKAKHSRFTCDRALRICNNALRGKSELYSIFEVMIFLLFERRTLLSHSHGTSIKNTSN